MGIFQNASNNSPNNAEVSQYLSRIQISETNMQRFGTLLKLVEHLMKQIITSYCYTIYSYLFNTTVHIVLILKRLFRYLSNIVNVQILSSGTSKRLGCHNCLTIQALTWLTIKLALTIGKINQNYWSHLEDILIFSPLQTNLISWKMETIERVVSVTFPLLLSVQQKELYCTRMLLHRIKHIQ